MSTILDRNSRGGCIIHQVASGFEIHVSRTLDAPPDPVKLGRVEKDAGTPVATVWQSVNNRQEKNITGE
ncbi:hypothetical protein N7492_003989 [Penicillium capsulatum]|uniref:Uncharacterized protein n=1 Tax=Penicillium capsulatum TaxID=69766 RepID=A0A9W9IKM7_9EURO|nr:hypothetical protein N7492_003989 [Penicillium capsulatum]